MLSQRTLTMSLPLNEVYDKTAFREAVIDDNGTLCGLYTSTLANEVLYLAGLNSASCYQGSG